MSEVPLPTLSRAGVAAAVALVGGAPTLLTAPEDRALAIGLPVIALSLGYLLTRIDDRKRRFTVDVVCAVLLAAPGIACNSWLALRGLDATNWYFPELQIMGLFEQAGAGGATIGILWGAALALLSLRGRRALPLASGMFTAGLWLGLGSLCLDWLTYRLYHAPEDALLLATRLTIDWKVGALLGAGVAGVAAHRTDSRVEGLLSVCLAAVLTGVCTVPVQSIATTLDLPALRAPVPAAPAGPRAMAILYDVPITPSPEALATLLQSKGQSTKPDTWQPLRLRKLQWHRALRLGLVVAVPPETSRETFDALARVARQHNALRLALAGRADGVPSGVMDRLLGWPTVGLLLDPPPQDTVWGTLHADGQITWDTVLPAWDSPPHCALRADFDVTVGTLTKVAFELGRRSRALRCRGIGWPPPRCHPEGPGDPLCPRVSPAAQ